MSNKEVKLVKLITNETKKVKKKNPQLENVDVVYNQESNGSFISKLKAKTRNRTIFLTEENQCQKTAVRKVFTSLSRLLAKRKYKKPTRLSFQLKEAL